MKMIKILLPAIFCLATLPTLASTVKDSDNDFCTAFIDESITMCENAAGGTACDISKNYSGMEMLYKRLISGLSGGSGELEDACKVATRMAKEPKEWHNCVNKWNCYRGTPSDSSCINPAGKHC